MPHVWKDLFVLTSRPYAGDSDRDRIRDFLVAASAVAAPPSRYWHVGALLWALYQNTFFDPRAGFRLWEDERGDLVALVYSEGPDEFDFQIHPSLRGTGEVESAILREAIDRAQAENPGIVALTTKAFAGDAATVDILTRHGFARDERTPTALIKKWGYPPDHFGYVHMARDLRQPVLDPAPPPGWTVRHVGG